MAHTPVEIGTRGTVGSLIMKEIKYFSQLELSCQGSSQKPLFPITDKDSSSSHSRVQTHFWICDSNPKEEK